MIKLLTIFLFASLFIACKEKGIKENHGDQEDSAPIMKGQWEQKDVGQLVELIKSEFISKKNFITSVEVGDRIHIAARGQKITPQFSIHVRSSKSHWMKKNHCNPHEDERGSCVEGWYKRSGHCQLLYRERQKNLEEPILLRDNIAGYPLQLVVGNKVYPATSVQTKDDWVFLELLVTEEMLENGNDFYLNILGIEPTEEVRVGFIEYKSCQGKGKKDFKVDGPKDFEIVPQKIENLFEISVTLEQKN